MRPLLLKGGRVVPITIELDGERRVLVISGPNTGGKTVALKTVGLLTLMAQSGIPVPADRAELPIFDAVLASRPRKHSSIGPSAHGSTATWSRKHRAMLWPMWCPSIWPRFVARGSR